MLDSSYQDIGFFASFRCAGNCRTGVLLRAQKTETGMKGIYVSLTQGDLASYRVTLDAQGQTDPRAPAARRGPASIRPGSKNRQGRHAISSSRQSCRAGRTRV